MYLTVIRKLPAQLKRYGEMRIYSELKKEKSMLTIMRFRNMFMLLILFALASPLFAQWTKNLDFNPLSVKEIYNHNLIITGSNNTMLLSPTGDSLWLATLFLGLSCFSPRSVVL